MTDDARDPVTIALRIDDPALADRVAAVLGGVAGVRLVTPGEPADLVLVSASKSADAVRIADEPTDVSDEDATAILTPREREVLTLLAEGASNKTIARRLGISVHTAKFHVGSLIDKLDASGRTDAVTHAARRGVIEL
ncbi:MAG TPA: helix-turn-helix transcriptional regulator [Casimicrobiaceae bacterium]|nr:helix-turn-helix transcriptional regulator [Casimicrobiaceae bacterium]